MFGNVAIGLQSFEKIRTRKAFYADKTNFIKEWWESNDDATLITRPRRFGKTLNLSMTECFFSNKYAGRADLFQGCAIWEKESYRQLQGTYPVIFISFAKVKATNYKDMTYSITKIFSDIYGQNRFLIEGELLSENEKNYFNGIVPGMKSSIAADAIHTLTNFLGRFYGKNVIILLDEYDTPMQEAWLSGYWDETAIWSLPLATGYPKVEHLERKGRLLNKIYTLKLTNLEVESMFTKMIRGWFKNTAEAYNGFIQALLTDDVDAMNAFMNRIALKSFSSFDTAKNASCEDAPERFYHGFVLGLMVGLEERFAITSNRESGFGRYDVMLSPVNKKKDKAYIIEFKVFNPKKEKNLEETVANALAQIEDKKYETELTSKSIPRENIRKYRFAFAGKKCLIG